MSEEVGNIETPSKKKKGPWKYIIYLTIILGFTALVLGLNLSGTTTYDGEEVSTIVAIGKIFGDINIGYILLFILIMVLANLVGALALFLFARLYTRKYKFHQAAANQMVGTFYNNITPGNMYTGGQFAQAITFKKQGVPISNAASVLVMQYIVYQTCLLILGLISLFRIDSVLSIGIITIGSVSIPIIIFIIAGFALNAILIGAMYLMSFSRKLHNFVLLHGVNLLVKLHIVVEPDRKRQELRIQIENFRIELRRLWSNIPFTILIFIVTFIVLILNDSFPFLIGLALNGFEDVGSNVGLKIIDSIVYTNYHMMICGLIPIPGNAGLSEFVFTSLFSNYYSSSFVSNSGATAAMLVWRICTYYLPLIVSGVIAIVYSAKGKRQDLPRLSSLDRNSFVTLQLETYEERRASSDTQYQTSSLLRKDLFNKLRKKKKNNPTTSIDVNAIIAEETESKETKIEEEKEVINDENSDLH